MTTLYKPKFGLDFMLPVTLVMSSFIFVLAYNGVWIVLTIALLLTVYLFFAFSTAVYEIKERNLNIRAMGWYKVTIPIDNIRKIEEVVDFTNSAAFSFDRLEIGYDKFESIWVSPKDKKGFIVHLKTLNPEIEVRLKRKTPKNNS